MPQLSFRASRGRTKIVGMDHSDAKCRIIEMAGVPNGLLFHIGALRCNQNCLTSSDPFSKD